MTFVGDPSATPRRTPGWPVFNGCVTAVKTLFTPISLSCSKQLACQHERPGTSYCQRPRGPISALFAMYMSLGTRVLTFASPAERGFARSPRARVAWPKAPPKSPHAWPLPGAAEPAPSRPERSPISTGRPWRRAALFESCSAAQTATRWRCRSCARIDLEPRRGRGRAARVAQSSESSS